MESHHNRSQKIKLLDEQYFKYVAPCCIQTDLVPMYETTRLYCNLSPKDRCEFLKYNLKKCINDNKICIVKENIEQDISFNCSKFIKNLIL